MVQRADPAICENRHVTTGQLTLWLLFSERNL
jgi:hypothetical protein